jgi:acyl-CoA dehydrogenase
MDFNLNDEELLFQKSVREMLSAKLAPLCREIDSRHEIPETVLSSMAEFGLLGITVPEKYGGPAGNMMMASLAAMEIAAADPSMATAVYYLLVNGWSHILNRYGALKLREELLPRITSNRAFLGIATTEPGGGSDLVAMKTSGEIRQGSVVINGEKTYISGMAEAKRKGGGHLTLVKTDPNAGHRGLTFVYVPADSKGLEFSVLDNMGRMGISTSLVHYKDVEVPAHYIIGEPNRGFFYAMEGFNYARTLVSAACLGAAQWALEVGEKYIKERRAFGLPLAKYESISFEYADLAVQIEMTRNEIFKAAFLLDSKDRGKEVSVKEINRAVAACKLVAPQLAFETIKKVMMWHGALSYTRDALLEMAMRGVISYLVGAEGALNVMRLIIIRDMLGPEYLPYR